MKTKLNVFCVLVLVSMVFSALFTFVSDFGGSDKYYGNAKSSAADAKAYDDASVYVNLIPNGKHPKPVVVKNMVDGKPVKLFINGDVMIARTYRSNHALLNVLMLAFALFAIFAFVKCIYKFIRFIMRVNKDHIFERDNVRLLHQTGWYYLFSLASYMAFNFSYTYFGVQGIVPEGYVVDYLRTITDVPLAEPFILLLFAEIFKIGVRLKEDQELTI